MPLTTSSRPTIIDVAARAGVSKSLVSLVMRGASNVSDAKRRLVLEAVAQLGYRPERRGAEPGAAADEPVRHRPVRPPQPVLHRGDRRRAGEAEAHGYRPIISTADRRPSAERRASTRCSSCASTG
jgi:DNA-binding LacI/PurR family transcriptional regulator